MTFIDRENVGGVDYAIQGTIPMGTCATPAGTEIKVSSFADNFRLTAGNLISVTFTYANTYGDGSTTYPKLTVNGTNYPIAYPTGEYAGDGAWANGQAVTFMFDGTKLNIVSAPKIQTTDKVQAGATLPVTSGGVANALGIPTDAVLHYSFDEVPDYPDGTAVYFRNKNFTTSDGWAGGNNVITAPNGILTVASVATAYIYKNVTSGSIVKCIITSSVDTTIILYASIGGTTTNLLSKAVKANIPTEFIATIPSGTLASVGFNGIQINSKFEIISFYIGDGSYTTPVIDNANGQNNGTNNGGIAVQGVSGKGVRFSGNGYISGYLPWKPIDQKIFTMSCWVRNWDKTEKLYLFNDWDVWGVCPFRITLTSSETNKIAIDSIESESVLYRLSNTNFDFSLLSDFFIVAIFSGRESKVYINGTNVTFQNISTSIPAPNAKDFQTFQIGRISLQNGFGYAKADIDDFQIYNRALSQEEVTALYLNKANTPKYYNLNSYRRIKSANYKVNFADLIIQPNDYRSVALSNFGFDPTKWRNIISAFVCNSASGGSAGLIVSANGDSGIVLYNALSTVKNTGYVEINLTWYDSE